MKIAVELGVTLNLGDYNSGRVSIRFEDELAEKEIELVIWHASENDAPAARNAIMQEVADELYQEVENKLIAKVEDFITRLEREKLV